MSGGLPKDHTAAEPAREEAKKGNGSKGGRPLVTETEDAVLVHLEETAERSLEEARQMARETLQRFFP